MATPLSSGGADRPSVGSVCRVVVGFQVSWKCRSRFRRVESREPYPEVRTAEPDRWAGHYGILFLLIMAALPLSAANVGWVRAIGVALQGGAVLFALRAARVGRHARRLAWVLVPMGVVLGVVGRLTDHQAAGVVAAVVNVLLPVAVIAFVVNDIVQEHTVSGRTVLGLLSIYLLIGMSFAAVFGLMAVVMDGPFFVQTPSKHPLDFLYFSFITLATVGYGDYTASQELPRILAAMEGLVGQLYLVTVVAIGVSRIQPRERTRDRSA